MLYTNTNILKEKINKLYNYLQPFFFVINYEMTEGYLVEDPIDQSEVYFSFPTGNNKPLFPPTDMQIKFDIIHSNDNEYKSKFDNLQKHLKNKDISYANLTEITPIETNLSLENIFALSRSPYQIYIPNRFACFSPERFVKIEKGKISTNPMKGTIDADLPNAENIIIKDKKEIEEHNAAVSLISKELELVADNIKVERYRYIDNIKTNRKNLLQISSEIVGTLKEDCKNSIGNTIFSLLPGASIIGEPKQKAIDIIRKVEKRERNYYCGIAGYFDGNILDSAVLIRFIEQDNGHLYFRSGGGVTEKSICNNEYQELLNKVYLSFI